jgi:hypothetical protein
MRKTIKLFLIGFIVVSLFVFVLGCNNEEKAATPSQETVANFQDMMNAVFESEAMYYVDIEDPSYGESGSGSGYTVTFDGDQSSGTFTIVFTDYQDYYYDITINGTITLAYSYSETTGTITIDGTLTFTGTDATVGSIGFNKVTVTVTGLDTQEPTVSVSGTATVDGVKYDASAFGLQDEMF